MTNPITPPPELVKQWEIDATLNRRAASLWTTAFATQAAQWGADTELEACVNWLDDTDCEDPQEVAQRLLAARRPKPPSLKEEALAALTQYMTGETILAKDSVDTIRRALEVSMPDPDYKALCAELLAALEIQLDELRFNNRLCVRARAALAQPKPVAPTDEELLEAFDGEFAEFFDSSDGFGTTAIPRSEWTKVARAVLSRWGTPAIAAELEAM